MVDRCHWYVYLVVCSDDSLYCGIAKNVERRVEIHNKGMGSKYTKSRLPVKFLMKIGPMTKSEALKEEFTVKQLKRDQKVAHFILNSNKYRVCLNF